MFEYSYIVLVIKLNAYVYLHKGPKNPIITNITDK